MRKIRTAIIGLGRIGWLYHVPHITAHNGFELVCVCDPLTERLNEAKDIYNVRTYNDAGKMFDSESPELVVVASPTQFHPQQSILAFEKGCDVFCEKPVAVTEGDADEVFRKMEQSGRKFMAYQPHRAGSDIQCLKTILNAGLLGQIFMIKRTRTDYIRRADWQAFSEFGGGMLNNFGSHIVDQLLYLADSQPKNVHCTAKRIASLGDAEDVVKIVIETHNGIILDIDINMASALPVQPWVVFGQYGTASLDMNNHIWNVTYCKPSELTNVSAIKSLAAKDRSYVNGETIKWYTRQFDISDYQPLNYYDECYKYFAMNEKPIVSSRETMSLIKTLCECKKQIDANTRTPALFANYDKPTTKFIRAFKEPNASVPGQISVVGVGSEMYSDLISPVLTTFK